jgi:tryptophanyl-tRNA synthetase
MSKSTKTTKTTKTKDKTISTFTYENRKSIAQSIKNVKDGDDLLVLLKIFSKDKELKSNSNTNSNGVFFNIVEASDKTLSKVSKYLDEIKEREKIKTEKDNEVTHKFIQNLSNIDLHGLNGSYSKKLHKLSNNERLILKHRQQHIKKSEVKVPNKKTEQKN